MCLQVDPTAALCSLPHGSDTEVKSDVADNSVDVAVCVSFIFLLTFTAHATDVYPEVKFVFYIGI